VSAPDAALNAATWYGQALATSAGLRGFAKSDSRYEGEPVSASGGWGAIEVEVFPLDVILAEEPVIDLIDLDVQGAEAEIVETSAPFLNERAKRLHIGTHSHEVEARLRLTLRRAGWYKLWDFPCLSTVNTTFGVVRFGDGVQGWINPRWS